MEKQKSEPTRDDMIAYIRAHFAPTAFFGHWKDSEIKAVYDILKSKIEKP